MIRSTDITPEARHAHTARVAAAKLTKHTRVGSLYTAYARADIIACGGVFPLAGRVE